MNTILMHLQRGDICKTHKAGGLSRSTLPAHDVLEPKVLDSPPIHSRPYILPATECPVPWAVVQELITYPWLWTHSRPRAWLSQVLALPQSAWPYWPVNLGRHWLTGKSFFWSLVWTGGMWQSKKAPHNRMGRLYHQYVGPFALVLLACLPLQP